MPLPPLLFNSNHHFNSMVLSTINLSMPLLLWFLVLIKGADPHLECRWSFCAPPFPTKETCECGTSFFSLLHSHLCKAYFCPFIHSSCHSSEDAPNIPSPPIAYPSSRTLLSLTCAMSAPQTRAPPLPRLLTTSLPYLSLLPPPSLPLFRTSDPSPPSLYMV
jgi:hypothetical protein